MTEEPIVPSTPPPTEPSVLDYVKALLTPWKGPPPKIPERQFAPGSAEPGEPPAHLPGLESPSAAPAGPHPGALQDGWTLTPEADEVASAAEPLPAVVVAAPRSEETPALKMNWRMIPWLALLGLFLALLAQLSFEPVEGVAERSWRLGVVFYGLGIGLIVFVRRDQWLVAAPQEGPVQADPMRVRWLVFAVSVVFSAVAYGFMLDNRFTTFNVGLWLIAILTTLWAFWLPSAAGLPATVSPGRAAWWRKILPPWRVTFQLELVLLLVVAGVVFFYRVYDLPNLPSEMISDHREKLQDVMDVLNGQTSIFFPRNTGREAMQFYLTAAIASWLGTGVSFISLKIGTVLAGLLTLPYLYLFAKEVGNRRVALLAVFFAGIAYWPNVLSRFGLRFPLYPLFVAPVLYYLVRGLRTSNRNDFILSGLALGIGLHGYTPIRILPVLVVIAVALFLLHRQSAGRRVQTIWLFAVLVLVSVIVFIPLLRFLSDPGHPEYPEYFWYRSFTRAFDTEQELPAPAWVLFWGNTWRALTMFAWDNGEIWVHSVPNRPALDVVAAALFYIGVALLSVRYFSRNGKHWQDIFLLLSVPILLMPSILSLAFPGENPALNRMGGAIVPVFTIVALALDGLLTGIERQRQDPRDPRRLLSYNNKPLVAVLVLVLAYFSARQNYDLVFHQYRQLFDQSSWNTSEIGQVIHDFANSVGSYEAAWVVPYPFWVDTQLVGINAGVPERDYALRSDNLATTVGVPGMKLFILNPMDQATLDALRQLYPQGASHLHMGEYQRNFIIYTVPAASDATAPQVAP